VIISLIMLPVVGVLWLYWYIGTFIAGISNQETSRPPLWIKLFWPWYLNLAKQVIDKLMGNKDA